MSNDLIIQKAIAEIENQSFNLTKQFLAIHDLVYDCGYPVVERVDREKTDGTAIVYFPVADEEFFFAIYLDTKPDLSVRWMGTENGNTICFRASSQTLSQQQLSEMTTLKPTSGRNKGDPRRLGHSSNILWKDSVIFFEPNPEPDEFEDKIKKLLDFLEQDSKGVIDLVENADGYIDALSVFHNGNTMLGGFQLDKEIIHRMSALSLEIGFSAHAEGNFFEDD